MLTRLVFDLLGATLHSVGLGAAQDDASRLACTLSIQGEALQEVGNAFSRTVGKHGDESSAEVSPLLAQALEHIKLASLGSLHLL